MPQAPAKMSYVVRPSSSGLDDAVEGDGSRRFENLRMSCPPRMAACHPLRVFCLEQILFGSESVTHL
jgi:hypothetical protein